MDVLKKWQVYCCTESNLQTCWRFCEPECCPNNPTHVIDHMQTVFVDKRAVNSHVGNTYVTKSWQDTNGYLMVQGYRLDVTAAGSNVVDFPLPTKRCVYGMRVNVTESNVGDSFTITINPGMPVGYLTSNVVAGQSNIPVSDTVLQNMVPGFFVKIGDIDDHMIQFVGSDVGPDAGMILCTPLQAISLPMYTPVLANVHIVKDFVLGCTGIHEIGYGSLAGKVMPAGTVINVSYSNVTGGDKLFSFNNEFSY
jgi:hypothetical protein